MKHLAFLAVALVMAWASTLHLDVDTCSTGFLITWLCMYLAVLVTWSGVVELARTGS